MNKCAALFMLFMLASTSAPAEHLPPERPVLVRNDPGGAIYHYLSWARSYEARGTHVVIDGYCDSACTLYTNVPNVCATDRAVLGFHKPWVTGRGGERVYTPAQDRHHVARYRRPAVRDWLARHPLQIEIVEVKATDLLPRCSGAS